MTIQKTNQWIVYLLTILYLIFMLGGFLLILQTEFPQIAFDNSMSAVVEAFRQDRATVISSHFLLGIGFILFYPLGLLINGAAPKAMHPLLNGLLTASLALRLLPWFGVLPLYFFLSSLSAEAITEPATMWNGLFIVLNTVGEDIAVNLLTGLWAMLMGIFLWQQPRGAWSRWLAGAGLGLGLLFVVSAGDLVGFDIIQAGNPLATLISPLLRIWIIVAALLITRSAQPLSGGE